MFESDKDDGPDLRATAKCKKCFDTGTIYQNHDGGGAEAMDCSCGAVEERRDTLPADAPVTETPWNWCPKCKQTVDDDMRTGEFRDGSEGTCIGCRTVYVAVSWSDESWSLVEADVSGDESEEDES